MPLSKYEGGRLWELLEHMGEILGEADEILEENYTCRVCGKTMAIEDHEEGCLGLHLDEAYEALAQVQQILERDFPNPEEQGSGATGN